jgi:hypothetical protein
MNVTPIRCSLRHTVRQDNCNLSSGTTNTNLSGSSDRLDRSTAAPGHLRFRNAAVLSSSHVTSRCSKAFSRKSRHIPRHDRARSRRAPTADSARAVRGKRSESRISRADDALARRLWKPSDPAPDELSEEGGPCVLPRATAPARGADCQTLICFT